MDTISHGGSSTVNNNNKKMMYQGVKSNSLSEIEIKNLHFFAAVFDKYGFDKNVQYYVWVRILY